MLESLGLGPLEEKVYLGLLEVPFHDLRSLARTLDLTTEDTQRSLDGLAERVLVVPKPTSGTLGYDVVEPAAAVSLLISRQEAAAREALDRVEQAHAAAKHLAERYRSRGVRHPVDLIELVVGRQAVLEQFTIIQQDASTQIRGIDAPPYVCTDNTTEASQLTAGVSSRWLYDTTALNRQEKLDEIARFQTIGEQARFLTNPPFKLVLADDRQAMIALTNEQTGSVSALIIGTSALLDGLSRMFEVLWSFAVVFHAGTSATDSTMPTAAQSKLLAMLAAGMTDRQIADRCGFSLRTAQTKVHGLLTALGVQTRFQAGLQAKSRGWL